MEIDLIFKTPDVIENALEELPLDVDARMEAKLSCEKWVKYGEIVKIRVNTETGKAVVLPAGR